jgi:molybdopterin molybdotransferase
MAQLSDDCFAFGGPLLPLDEALRRIAERVQPIAETEKVPLRAALGRVLAVDLVAGRDVPPYDNSAVDGYAVRYADLKPAGNTQLAVTGRAAAGHPAEKSLGDGEAVRIFTGAPMPVGADTVYMEEDCVAEGDAVTVPHGIERGANRRGTGEDVMAGSLIVPAGRRLRAQELGIAASVGITVIPVYRRLSVAVFSTGDEVRDPAGDAPPGCIFDANRFTVMGMLEDLGCTVTDLGVLPDERDAIEAALVAAAGEHDVLITSGGVSLGEEDHVGKAVEQLGSLYFWRLAIKPGRPIALGQIGATAFVGLPGNPVAAMVTFLRVARPLLLRLAGRRDVEPARFSVRAGFSARKKEGRREWLRVRLERDNNGATVARRFAVDGAGILSSMVAADGLVELGEDVGTLEEGAMVDYLPFSDLMR